MKKLPIGIQTFENLILEGYYYVDKTPFRNRPKPMQLHAVTKTSRIASLN